MPWLARIGIACVLAALPVYGALADTQPTAFAYPIDNPFLATIVGTPPAAKAPLPPAPRFRTRRLPRLPDRAIPPAFWYADRLAYSYALQPMPAPLMFVIAGTGGYHDGGTNRLLMQVFHAAGYHVVGMSSPTHPEFIVSTSTTGAPGHLENDARDLLSAMQRIRQRLPRRAQITGHALAGSSLGATNAAFIARLDASENRLGFDHVLLANPSVSLYNSISRLDRMLWNIPGGIDNFDRFFRRVVSQIGGIYTRSTSVEFTPELVFSAFAAEQPRDEELAAVIGVAFRIAAANMIFTADSMTNFGFIKPSQQRVTRRDSLRNYLPVALRLGFTDYFHEFFWPLHADSFEGDRSDFARAQSLAHIADYLRAADHVAVFHALDDIILADGEIEFLRETFGERAFIYPLGGHLGNLGVGAVRDDMLRFVGR
ncbi:MAG: alpha/beta hydrolase [Pseudomonadota bacterium]